ncbi:FliI/YscN family ATPase [Terriglobus sp. 2YAB30_2]|uniref:FliI/YscN family ATPase n=2 Tax=unclassified Terriglobus TaxID=2628988 RepID=UPI003F9C2140
MRLQRFHARLSSTPSWRWSGRVAEAEGQLIEADGPPCSVGECCEIVADGNRLEAEVVGIRGSRTLLSPVDAVAGVRFGAKVFAMRRRPSLSVSEQMLGRVFDAGGQPIDGGPSLDAIERWPLDVNPPGPMERKPIREPLGTGLRVIDGVLSVGRGQRIGIFGGSGVGKSTLIGMMTRNTSADLTVVGLVGERGREVGEFLEDAIGEEGRKRSVVMVATSDQSPLMRMRVAMSATSVAEYFAAQGKNVLLVLDSVTRFAMAAREIGLAAGEPPASKGYTPSVFAKTARLLERAGNFQTGSITAFYTVLMEGDDQQDPIVDSVRSIVDGHIVLSRQMAGAGWYPPVNVVDSVSRLMPAVTTPEHLRVANHVRRLLSAYAKSEDLIRIGAYQTGNDAELDEAVRMRPVLQRFLQQTANEQVDRDAVLRALFSLGLGS